MDVDANLCPRQVLFGLDVKLYGCLYSRHFEDLPLDGALTFILTAAAAAATAGSLVLLHEGQHLLLCIMRRDHLRRQWHRLFSGTS